MRISGTGEGGAESPSKNAVFSQLMDIEGG